MDGVNEKQATRGAEEIRQEAERVLHLHVARFLDSHGGAVEIAHVTDEGDVTLSFRGACKACPAAAATFHSKVEPALRKVPGVRSVEAPNSNISAAAIRRILEVTGVRSCEKGVLPLKQVELPHASSVQTASALSS